MRSISAAKAIKGVVRGYSIAVIAKEEGGKRVTETWKLSFKDSSAPLSQTE